MTRAVAGYRAEVETLCQGFRRCRLVLAVTLMTLAASAFAVDYTWTGNAGNAQWESSGNWNPSGGYPDRDDVAIVSDAVTLTPPASFAGTLRVGAAVKVTLAVSSSVTFKLLLPTEGSVLEKTGVGSLTVSHAYGVAKGTLVAAAGKVCLQGNGGQEAPGAFNEIVVKSGASAEVVNSPIATAHGIVYRVGKRSSKVQWGVGRGYGVFYDDALTHAEFVVGWDPSSESYFNPNAQGFPVETACYVPTEGRPALYLRNGVPSPYDSSESYYGSGGLGAVVYLVRGIVLNETASPRKNYIVPQGYDAKICYSLFCDGVVAARSDPVDSRFCDYYKDEYKGGVPLDKPLTTSGALGWNAVDFLVENEFDTYGRMNSYPQYLCESLVEGGHERLVPGVLWCGACCNSCTVESGATLTVADGQAFAVANARGLKVLGSLTSASANTCLFLGSAWGEGRDLKAAALKDFTGKVEVGATSKLDGDETGSTASYSVSGRGELGMCNGFVARVDPSFGGFVSVPAGETYDWDVVANDFDGEKMSALYPVSSETWAFKDNISVATPETADAPASFNVLDASTYASSQEDTDCRASLIAKTPMPAYCPFEITADIYRDGQTGMDFEWGFCVQPENSVNVHWNAEATTRLSYVLPGWSPCFGSFVLEYSSYCSLEYTTNKVTSAGDYGVNVTGNFAWQNVTPVGSWTWTKGKPNKYWLRYDGFGTVRSGFTGMYCVKGVNEKTLPGCASCAEQDCGMGDRPCFDCSMSDTESR